MEHWKKEFRIHGLQLLDDLLNAGKSSPRALSVAVECNQLSDASDSYSCLKLLRQLLYTAIRELTCQQYTVRTVLLDSASSRSEAGTTLSLDELIDANNCTNGLDACKKSTELPCQALLPVPSPETGVNTHSAGMLKRKRGRPKKLNDTVAASEEKPTESCQVTNDSSKVANQCNSSTGKTALNLRRSQRKTRTSRKFSKESFALGSASDSDCSYTDQDSTERSERRHSAQQQRVSEKYSTLSRHHCLVFKQPACCMCESQFSTMADCLGHWRTNHFVYNLHKTKAYINCSQCPVQFSLPASRLSSDIHVEIQIARWLKHAVRLHGVAVPVDVIEQFHCSVPKCRFVALTKAALSKHEQRNQHCTGSSRPARLVCERCGKQLKSSALSAHLRVCQRPLDSRHTIRCPHCSARLASRYSLRCHVRTLHSSLVAAAKQFFCNYCAYASNKRGNFVEHVYRCHGINVSTAAVYSCQLCSYTTVKPSSLRRHCRQAHDNTRNISCPVCNKAFKCQLNLKTHMLVHQEYQERRFPCTLCTYRAARKTNLEAHINAQHSSSQRRFHCSACGYATGYAANLSKHQRLFCKYRHQTADQMDIATAADVQTVGTTVETQQATEFAQGLVNELVVTVTPKPSINGAAPYTDCYSFSAVQQCTPSVGVVATDSLIHAFDSVQQCSRLAIPLDNLIQPF